VADDSPAYRSTAVAVVEATSGFDLLAAVTSGEEAVRLALAADAGMILLDLRMPAVGGIEAAHQISAARPQALIVLMTATDDVPARWRRCGARAVIRKHELRPTLLRELWDAYRPGSGQ